jgi:hypothetical protein
LYSQIKQKIVVNENMMNNDRNSNDFETVLRKMNASRVGQLTVGLAKSFSLCTSNLDPSLRKMVREQRGTTKPDTEQNEDEEVDQAIILKEVTGDAEFLFDDVSVWFSITKQLAKMTIGI